MQIKEVLQIAIKAGEIVISSGAEIYRVEEAIYRICYSYGIEVECFVLSTGIFISCQSCDENPITILKRIKYRTNNFLRLEKINDFVRIICKNPKPYKDAMKELANIESIGGYNLTITLLAGASISFIFTLFFKGNILEATIAFFISLIVFYTQIKFLSPNFFTFFEYFAASLIGGTLCIISSKFISNIDIYRLIIGFVMLLVPGGLISNGMKEALKGDVVSSLYKLFDAAFIATAIACGIGLTLSLGYYIR